MQMVLAQHKGDCDDTDVEITKRRLYEDLDGDGSENFFIYSCDEVEEYAKR